MKLILLSMFLLFSCGRQAEQKNVNSTLHTYKKQSALTKDFEVQKRPRFSTFFFFPMEDELSEFSFNAIDEGVSEQWKSAYSLTSEKMQKRVESYLPILVSYSNNEKQLRLSYLIYAAGTARDKGHITIAKNNLIHKKIDQGLKSTPCFYPKKSKRKYKCESSLKDGDIMSKNTVRYAKNCRRFKKFIFTDGKNKKAKALTQMCEDVKEVNNKNAELEDSRKYAASVVTNTLMKVEKQANKKLIYLIDNEEKPGLVQSEISLKRINGKYSLEKFVLGMDDLIYSVEKGNIRNLSLSSIGEGVVQLKFQILLKDGTYGDAKLDGTVYSSFGFRFVGEVIQGLRKGILKLEFDLKQQD